jgi:DNA-binding MarR family transcriptional regulator
MRARTGEERLASGLRRLAQSFTLRSLQEWRGYVKSSGLSIQQYIVLMQLLHGGTCGVRQIGEKLEISSPAASQLVNRLVEAGLARRSESSEDRRAKRVSLTEKGRELASRGFGGHLHWVDELAASIDAADRAAVLEALPRLLQADEKLAGHAPAGGGRPGGRM